MFKIIDGDTAVLEQGGTWKVVDLYEFKDCLFAKYGSGFIRLNMNKSTSKGGVNIKDIFTNAKLFVDRHGRICTKGDKKITISNLEGELKIEKVV